MAPQTYTLENLIVGLDRITKEEISPEAITEKIAPLLGRLIQDRDAIPPRFRRRAPHGGRGRYMLHRAARFNVTSVVWGPGDTAAAHNHETWGIIGVVENTIQETRYRVLEEGAGRAKLEVKEVLRHRPGAISRLVPGDEIHAMHNPTDRDTVEIHIYGKDLTGLKRRTWDPDGNEKPLVSPKYLNC
ncbi:MAG: cysteine dioxygenase family protein [Deltaproteobacteria bacterium]|nr:cysteine dioxygenase family protein [Deltaproteobacteria bacterium]